MAAAGEIAAHRLVEANLRLVVMVARRYAMSGVALADLIQEGNIGLLRAVESFDGERGFRFSTYATWWIRRAVTLGISSSDRLIRLPPDTLDAAMSCVRSRNALRALGHEPTMAAVAADCGRDTAETTRLLAWPTEPAPSVSTTSATAHASTMGATPTPASSGWMRLTGPGRSSPCWILASAAFSNCGLVLTRSGTRGRFRRWPKPSA